MRLQKPQKRLPPIMLRLPGMHVGVVLQIADRWQMRVWGEWLTHQGPRKIRWAGRSARRPSQGRTPQMQQPPRRSLTAAPLHLCLQWTVPQCWQLLTLPVRHLAAAQELLLGNLCCSVAAMTSDHIAMHVYIYAKGPVHASVVVTPTNGHSQEISWLGELRNGT